MLLKLQFVACDCKIFSDLIAEVWPTLPGACTRHISSGIKDAQCGCASL